MGSSSAETEVEFEAAPLLTFEGDFAATAREIEVSRVEVVDAIDSVDFGDVGIDNINDRYDQD